VTDFIDFTGRAEAVDSVQLRARVSGYLHKINFKEGDEVQKDQVLFEIDDRTFKAERDQAQATAKLNEAQVKEAEVEYNRDARLRTSGSVSQEALERTISKRDQAQAGLDAARADLQQKQLNLDYTRVVAPISGRADRAKVTVGNVVTANANTSTVLTTIVTLEPMYVTFNVDEPTLLRLRQLVQAGKLRPAAEKAPEVFIGVGRGEDYPLRGTVQYIGNQVEAATGTLPVRAVVPNKDRLLRPGLFARVRVPVGDPHPTLLVNERALATNQGQKYLYVVNDKNEVVYRPVTVGGTDGGLQIIQDGLKPGERVIIDGVLRVRPGAVVDPKPGHMDASPNKEADKTGKPADGPATTR
jgi:RND family efflux transporter MFP subunit